MQFRIQNLLNFSFSNGSRINYVNKRLINASRNEKKTTEEIVMPKAISRGPTEILKVLSSTVEKDYTGPHYKYLDDPYLTPINNVDKRSYSLSKESGRKTARYFIENYPELFFRDISEPKIDAFTYKEIYDDSMQFDEMDLKKSIIRCDVSNAIVCYEKLVKEQMPIDKETLYDLLDLVCFFNCENESICYLEEEFFQKTLKKQNIVNTWKDNGFAEKLFESIEPKNSRAYSSIIMGMAKYNQIQRAFSLYSQAIDSKFCLNTDTYNALIDASYYLHTSNDDRWKTIVDLLKTMNTNKIPPNVGTLNSVLKQLSKYKFWDQNSDKVKKIFNEFAFKFNIKPSLATYYHLLTNFYRSKNAKSPLIYEIVNKISDERFQPQDVDDIYFLWAAMDVAFNLNDVQLAYKTHKIAENNPHLIGPNFTQSNYYFKFLKLLCLSESIENFMNIYSRYVPNVYTPNIDLMEHILKTIKLYKALNYIPRIYDDIRLFYYNYHNEILLDLLLAMDEIQKDDPLLPQFVEIGLLSVSKQLANNILFIPVTDLFTKTNLKIAKIIEMGYEQTLNWTGKTLSLCLSILNKGQDIDTGFEIIDKMNSIRNEMFDEPESQPLIEYFKLALASKRFDNVIYCLKFCKDVGKQDVIDAVKEILDETNIILDEGYKKKIQKLLD